MRKISRSEKDGKFDKRSGFLKLMFAKLFNNTQLRKYFGQNTQRMTCCQ